MHPAFAGLIGACVTLAIVALVIVARGGRENWRKIEAQRLADKASREVSDVLKVFPSGAMLVGPHDEILVANEAGVALGLVRGTRVGFSDLLETIREVRGTDQAQSGQFVRLQPGSDPFRIAAKVVPMVDNNVLILATDESARLRAEAMRRDFVANVSHELKTPIGAVSVLAEAIDAAKDDPEEVARFSVRLQREIARLAELVNQIIELSRLQSADPLMNNEAVAVESVIAEAVSRSQEKANQRQVNIVVAGGSQATVLGDRWQLVDAVTNLVQNAINYSDERARVVISIQQVTDQGDSFVDIKVSDNGIGIKPEDQERIFERFYRVDYGRSRETGGTGLGLSIVRHIAVAHGGSVKVWSSPGQGSTFTLRLPAHLEPLEGMDEDHS